MVASIGHYVANKPVAGKSGRSGEITNPATGEVTAKVAFASVEEVDAAVQVAKKAQLAWAATPPLRRQPSRNIAPPSTTVMSDPMPSASE